MKNLLPETIIKRTMEIVKNNPSIDMMKAIKLAFAEEQKFIEEMIEQKTERAIHAKEQVKKTVFWIM